MGKKVEEFENNIAEYLNVNHAVVMNNGTASMLALDIKQVMKLLFQVSPIFHLQM